MKLKNIYHKMLMIMPKSLAHKIIYYRYSGKKLNLKNPKDLNEKIHYLMVYKYRKKYGQLADKYLVRDYIKEKGYEKNLTKLYGVYDNVEDIPIKKLPNKFVLKPNNGSGDIFICTDKASFDINKCKKKLKIALKTNFAEKNLEYHYLYIQPKIICEELLEDNQNTLPLDYKFYCFDGHVECVLLCSNREHEMKADYYDLNWKPLLYSKEKYRSNKIHLKPKNFEKMIEMASDLSKGFCFVRVDLYNINGKIYFGEMTFTPAGGYLFRNTQESLDYLGSLVNLEMVKKE